MKLGIDVGGVIISRTNDNTDTSFFSKNYLHSKMETKAFSTIQALARRFDEVWLVSKCGARVQAKTIEWLEHHSFSAATGVPMERVRFCTERHHKELIAIRYGLTHFIDDRLEVLSYLKSVPHRYLFKPSPAEVTKFQEHLAGVHRVESWPAALERCGLE